jgi:hypothetical protein
MSVKYNDWTYVFAPGGLKHRVKVQTLGGDMEWDRNDFYFSQLTDKQNEFDPEKFKQLPPPLQNWFDPEHRYERDGAKIKKKLKKSKQINKSNKQGKRKNSARNRVTGTTKKSIKKHHEEHEHIKGRPCGRCGSTWKGLHVNGCFLQTRKGKHHDEDEDEDQHIKGRPCGRCGSTWKGLHVNGCFSQTQRGNKP